VVNDYITQLKEVISLLNTNVLIPYVILNKMKQLPNNKAPGRDKITTAMLKNNSFKIILYYTLYFKLKLYFILNILLRPNPEGFCKF